MTKRVPPWPRRLVNFPIILIAITQELVWAAALIWEKGSVAVTAINILSEFLPVPILAYILIITPILAAAGFSMKRRINTVLALVPQQFLLYLSAGGALEAMWYGRFADGVERTQAFLIADQCPAFLIAFFHTWAMVLILRYGED